MGIILLIFYIAALIAQIVFFVKYCKDKMVWWKPVATELVSLGIAFLVAVYYDSLPGYGFMPGLSYLGEILFSYAAMILYGIMLVITLITVLIRHLIYRKKQGKNYFPIIKKTIRVITVVLFALTTISLISYYAGMSRIEKAEALIVGNQEEDENSYHPIVQYTISDRAAALVDAGELPEGNTYTVVHTGSLSGGKYTEGRTMPVYYDINEPTNLFGGIDTTYPYACAVAYVIEIIMFFVSLIGTGKQRKS